MSVTLYDKALLEKLQSWTSKSKIQVFGPAEVKQRLEVLSDLNKDSKIKLPFLTLSRPDGYTINNMYKRPQTYNGKKFIQDENTSGITVVNAIPITINYLLDVYSRYEEEADAFIRELVFNFINYPSLKITIPYLNTGLVHESTVRMSSEVISPNSSSMAIRNDQVFNYGIQLKIDDAYLWDVRVKDAVELSGLGLSYPTGENNDGDIVVENVNNGDTYVEKSS